MASAETINIEVGYEDDGSIIFVDLDKKRIPLIRKALAYLHKQEQEEKQKAKKLASSCRNCNFSLPRSISGTLCCTKRIVHTYYKKVVKPNETCELFERKEDKK